MNTDYRADLEAKIPPALLQGVALWIEHAIPPGHFLTCVLENDLFGAFGRADDQSTRAMPELVAWIYNYAPLGCYGSREQMRAWAERVQEPTTT